MYSVEGYRKKYRTIYDPNEIITKGDIAEIVLYDKYCKEKARTIIDSEDVGKVEGHKWCLSYGYVMTNLKGTTVKIQNFITGINPNIEKLIDHRDGNPLNNRKSNYRLCTSAENIKNAKIRADNTSGYKGVCWKKDNKKWMARIMFNKKRVHLGVFNDKTDAAKAYNSAAIKHFGEFACQNKI